MQKKKKDKNSIETIAKHLEEDYKPINSDLSEYEKKQELDAVISIDELFNKSKKEEKKEILSEDDFLNKLNNIKKNLIREKK